jgi:hypothetical protein
MKAEAVIADVTKWDRVGGRELQFFATDAEVERWLTQELPEQYSPYHLVGSDLVEDGPIYVQRPFQCEFGEMLECRHGSGLERHNFWIWSELLTPSLPLRQGDPIVALCSYSGLVLLQHGFVHHGRRDVSRISMVDKVRHLETGEVLQHEGYFDIYKTLRKKIKKALCYATIWSFADGSERESDRGALWTEGTVQEYEAGVPFVARPGRRLEKATAKSRS